MDIAWIIARQFVRFWIEQAVDRIFETFQLILIGEVEEGTEVGVQGLAIEGMGGGDEDLGGGDGDMGGADMWEV